MNILYLGSASEGATSLYRAQALGRLGGSITIIDPQSFVPKCFGWWLLNALNYRTGYLLSAPIIIRALSRSYLRSYDVVWVDGGEMFGPACIKYIRSVVGCVILYNHDDPTGSRDWARFISLRKALRYYDHSVVVRKENVEEFRRLGARSVQLVWRSYDEIEHAPLQKFCDSDSRFDSDVVFIGTRIPGEGREEFLMKLIDLGVPLSIWGDGWQRANNWGRLRNHWRGGALAGRDYVAAIQRSKIALGLLSKQNRDLHTTRTAEIPYAGGLLCAERTSDHLYLFKEGEEAVFWSSAEECAAICKALLGDPEQASRIREAGRKRVVANGLGNESVLSTVVDKIKLKKEMD